MPEAGAVKTRSSGTVNVSHRLEKAITELRRLQKLLVSGQGLDPRILTDFREALNRIRKTAWSAQQYIALNATDQDSASVLSILAGERVRAAYQLCQAIQIDLTSSEVKFQTGQLIQLHAAAQALTEQLSDAVGNL
jgi:hypothetical protein